MSDNDAAFGLSESLFAEFLRQRDAGESVSFEALCENHPEHAASLRDLHSQWRSLENVRQRAHDAPPALLREDGPTLSFLRRLKQRPGSFERYEVGELLGRGGFGEVLRVRDRDLERSLAMKVLKPLRPSGTETDPGALARFLAEAQITGQLDHPGVVPIHEVGVSEDGRVYYTMREVHGADLRSVFDDLRAGRNGRTLSGCVELLRRVCETMAFAHRKAVVHRDLKPANVMVGEFGEVYVMDWGLATALGRAEASDVEAASVRDVRSAEMNGAPDSPLKTLGAPGTPEYMPPERATGASAANDARGDVFSLGAMLYELLAGHAPYHRGAEPAPTPAERMARVVAGPPPSIELLAPDAPAELIAVCEKATARDPQRRYATMREFADDLRAYLDGRVVRAHRTGAWVEFVKWVGRNKSTAASLAAALTILLGASIAVGLQNQTLAKANTEKDDANSALVAKTESERAAKEEALRNASEAVAAREESQRRLAESYFQQARLATQRGEWRNVLSSLERAKAEGFGNELLLSMERARALIAVADKAEAAKLLDELLARTDLGAHQGEALLWRANLMMSDEKQQPAALELVSRALAAGLPPAEEAFAHALTAQTLPQVVELLGKALELDPFHQQALVYLPLAYFMLGRQDDALVSAERARQLHPEDPTPLSVSATIFALRGEPDRAQELVDQMRQVLSPESMDALEALLDSVSVVLDNCSIEDFIGAPPPPGHAERSRLAVQRLMTQAQKLRKSEGDWRELETLDPSMPALRQGYAQWIAAMNTGIRTMHWDYRVSERSLAKALIAVPEGTLHFLHAGILMQLPQEDFFHIADKLAWGEHEYRAACLAPSILPIIPRVAHFWAAYAQLILASSHVLGRDAQMERRAYESLDWLIAQPDLLAYECAILLDHLISRDLSTDVAMRLVNRWAEIDPRDPGMLAAKARVRLEQGAFELALAAADELVEVAGADAATCGLRDEVLSAARSFARNER